MAASVLVMARAPVVGLCKRRLEAMLGPQGCVRLQEVLLRRAAEWAVSVAPGSAHLSFSPSQGRAAVAAVMPEGVNVVAQTEGQLGARLAASVEAAALASAGAAAAGPLLIAGVDMPTLGPDHAAAALDDLAHGCDVSFGPSTDGGCYLVGLARPDARLLERSIGAWGREEISTRLRALAASQQLSVGLLRTERELHAPADVRALLADPMAPKDVVEVLG
jgi:glycosyltransferase A (GT-A) superfamily protein (DUF2064 family)